MTRRRAAARALAALVAFTAPAWAGPASDEFDRARFREGFAHEIAFREAAIQVAWSAEPLCDDTTEIEPFVLWSTASVKRWLSDAKAKLFTEATGMDEHWRIAWLDEGAPDELKPKDVVVAVNDRALPKPSLKIDVSSWIRQGAAWTQDDKDFWDVLQKARDEANDAGQRMTLTLADGRKVAVSTQTGCAGAVVATAFDDEPHNFHRLEGRRAKLPGNALALARERDEFRWLAAFGLYFLASEGSLLRERDADRVGGAFKVGQVLATRTPGLGTLLSLAEYKTQRAILVETLVGRADLFANEVVMGLGGDPRAGLRLAERAKAAGTPIDVVAPDEFRRSTIEEHLRQLAEIDEARKRAEAIATLRRIDAQSAPSAPAAAPRPAAPATAGPRPASAPPAMPASVPTAAPASASAPAVSAPAPASAPAATPPSPRP